MVETTIAYSSPLLVLFFIGFCAVIIVAQLVPAVLMLFGAVKAVTPQGKVRHKVPTY